MKIKLSNGKEYEAFQVKPTLKAYHNGKPREAMSISFYESKHRFSEIKALMYDPVALKSITVIDNQGGEKVYNDYSMPLSVAYQTLNPDGSAWVSTITLLTAKKTPADVETDNKNGYMSQVEMDPCSGIKTERAYPLNA